jgi:ketopantoate hydroxymethyltransferase
VKKYASLRELVLSAVKKYEKEVEEGRFPSEEYSYY